MYKIALLLSAATFSGCATVDELRYGKQSTNPPPTDELTAVANFKNSIGSQELAFEQAEKTCRHWNAGVGVINSTTVNLTETKTVKDTAENLAKSAIELTLFDPKFPYQTTLKYKCYQ